jgi:hypothetical protein
MNLISIIITNADLHAVAIDIYCPASPDENNFENSVSRAITSIANTRYELRHCPFVHLNTSAKSPPIAGKS